MVSLIIVPEHLPLFLLCCIVKQTIPPAAVAWPEPGNSDQEPTKLRKEKMGFIQLFILLAVMFISTFILGSLPLYLSTSLSPARFHQLSIFSVGLLIGAALTIVIPEGIDTIYSSTIIPTSSANQTIQHDLNQQQHHHHSAIGLSLMGGFMLMFLIDQITRIPNLKNKSTLVPAVPNNPTKLTKVICSDPSSSSQSTRLLSAASLENGPAEEEGAGWNQDGSIVRRRGRSKTMVMMMMMTTGLNANLSHEEEVNNNRQKKTKNSRIQSNSFSTVIGLLTHSLADGIALGASSVPITTPIPTSNATGKRVQPSRSNSSFPGDHGFSLAAPMGALLTYLGLTILNKLMHSSSPADVIGGNLADISPDIVHYGFKWWIGVTLLFSGGTFLFVATHALQTSSSSDVHRVIDPCCPIPQSSELLSSPEPELPAHSSSPSDKHSSALVGPAITCALMVLGMCFPFALTSLVGTHHH
ncbi:hypothetical protein PSTT_10088 [Puccinia striiformis]|uniref:Uncharacterized protein n=1 Tax=Puccinia striiformis TaxID=27350 RepID=A0A2S4V5R6_9BASI|nr:hypothetical protein PSTT_10088 [Puccinia striiformis]